MEISTKNNTYAVMSISENSWHVDGSAVVERECGHKHRTLTGANRCKDNLQKPWAGGGISAQWYRCEIRHTDESPLTESEQDELERVRYIQWR